VRLYGRVLSDSEIRELVVAGQGVQ
jgi:hypothetical protein